MLSFDEARGVVASCAREVATRHDASAVQLLAVEAAACAALGVARFEDAGQGAFGTWCEEHPDVLAGLPTLRAAAATVRPPAVPEGDVMALAAAVVARAADASNEDASVALDDAVNRHWGLDCGCSPLGHGSAEELIRGALQREAPGAAVAGAAGSSVIACLAVLCAPIGVSAVAAAAAPRERALGLGVAAAVRALATVPLLASVGDATAWRFVFEGDHGSLRRFIARAGGVPPAWRCVETSSGVFVRVADESPRPLETSVAAVRSRKATHVAATLCSVAAFEHPKLVAVAAAVAEALSSAFDEDAERCEFLVAVLRAPPVALRALAFPPLVACALRAFSLSVSELARVVGAREFIEVVLPLCDADDVAEPACVCVELLGRTAVPQPPMGSGVGPLAAGAAVAAAAAATAAHAAATAAAGEEGMDPSESDDGEGSDGDADAAGAGAASDDGSRVPKSVGEATSIVASAQAIYSHDNEHVKQLLDMISKMMPHLSTGLYSDTRCLYEVLQNADDARCVCSVRARNQHADVSASPCTSQVCR